MSESSIHRDGPQVTIRCSCGAVDMSGTGQPVDVSTCHCHTCREIPSKPLFRTFAKFKRDQIKLDDHVNSKLDVRQTSRIAHRAYCRQCNDVIYMTHVFLPNLIGFPVEIIHGEGLKLESTRHIFMEDADEKFDRDSDDKPKYDGFPSKLGPE